MDARADRAEFVLSGKTALVTGAAKRIGRAVSLALADAGANVIVHYGRSAREAEELAGEVNARGVQSWTVQADLGNAEACAALIGRCRELAGGVQILINNASIFPESRLGTFTAEELAENMQVNALAPLQLAREMVKGLEAGRIVNFLDARITHYDRAHAAYQVSKRALFTLTRMMAMEFAPRVTVNAVAPGLILPPPGKDESYLAAMKDRNLLNRVGSLADITEAALFLLRSPFITGQVIFVDGGYGLLGGVYG